jgi:hypothetical protein
MTESDIARARPFDLDQGIAGHAQFPFLGMKAKDFTVVKRPTLPKIQSAQPMIIGS